MRDPDPTSLASFLIGLGALGSAVTGVVALLLAVAGVLQGEAGAAGFALVAAAIAFGLLFNGLARSVR